MIKIRKQTGHGLLSKDKDSNSFAITNVKKEKGVFLEGSANEDTSQLPCLEMRIIHSGKTHEPQKPTDNVVYKYKSPTDGKYTTLDLNKNGDDVGSEDTNEEITYEDQDKTVSVKKSLIDSYRARSNYYGPLRIISEKIKVNENGVLKEAIQAKLQHVEIQAMDNDGNPVNEHELKILMSQTPGIIPATDPLSENSKLGEFMLLVLGDGERYKVSKKALSAFQKKANVKPPFNTKIQKIFTTNENKKSPVTIVTLYPRVDKVIYHSVLLNNKKEPLKKLITKKHKGKPRLVNYYRQNYINWAHRGNVFFSEIKKAGVDFFKDILVENPTVEDSLKNLGLSMSSAAQHLEPTEPLKNDVDAVNGLGGSREVMEDIWNYLADLVRSDTYLIEFEFEMDSEKWLEIKRAFNMFQINGEVIPDIVLKVVSKKVEDSYELSYYLRCVGKLIKSGHLLTKTDVDDILKCLAKDKYICIGFAKDDFLRQVDQNEMLRLHMKEHCYLSIVPFESIHDKKCKAIVRDLDNCENAKVKRGSVNIYGPSVMCQPCSTLFAKLNDLLDPSLTFVTTQEGSQRLVRQRYGPLHSINISENIKKLFTQSPAEFVSGVKRKLTDSADEVAKQFRTDPELKALFRDESPSINVSEEEFEKLVSIKKISKSGGTLRKECEVCQFQAKSMLSLFVHMEDHLGTLNEQCDDCGIKLSNKEALVNHKKLCVHSRKNMKCSECHNIFPSSEKLFEHVNIHRIVKPFTCGICDLAFQTMNEYKKHLKVVHQIKTVKELNFYCTVCHSYFYTNDHLLIHKLNQNHFDKEHFTCKICNFSCSLAAGFQTHLLSHTFEQRERNNLVICVECKKLFFSSFRLESHFKNKHGTPFKEKSTPPQPAPTQQNYEVFTCSKCYRVYGTLNGLQKHIDTYHTEKVPEVQVPSVSVSGTVCTVCGRKFSSEHMLTGHMKLHTANRPVFQCEECGYVYGKRAQVLEHIRNDHAEQVQKHQQMQQQQQQQHGMIPSTPIYGAQPQPFSDAQVLTIGNQNQMVQQPQPDSWNQLKIPNVDHPQEVGYQFSNFNTQFF